MWSLCSDGAYGQMDEWYKSQGQHFDPAMPTLMLEVSKQIKCFIADMSSSLGEIGPC